MTGEDARRSIIQSDSEDGCRFIDLASLTWGFRLEV